MCPWYDSKLCEGEDPLLNLLGRWCTHWLPLLSGPLWTGIPVRVPSMGQIELFNHLLYLKAFNSVQTNNWYLIELLVFAKLDFRNRMVLKMKGNRTGVVKVHCKSSGKRCNGKNNIRTIFIGDTVSRGTFKRIYNVGTMDKFSRWRSVIRNN